ncbi:MAG: hypothetical protein J0H08_02235 [Rhizobiales bacterium]|nr:hypothetical protein [Hyphomicrobiales bacterium]
MQRIIAAWRRAKGWRTLLVSVLIAVVSVLQSTDWRSLIPEDRVGPVMMAIGLVMAVLRIATNGPVGRK